jgi:competence protein ComEA
MTTDHDRRLERWTSWLQATPAELVGLCALLLGGLAVAGVLWWAAVQRPAGLPPADARSSTGAAGADAVGDGVGAEPWVHQEGAATAPPPLDDGHGGPTDAAGGDRDGAHADAHVGQPAVGDDVPIGDVVVHVSGAVARGGLVTLPAGARVGDAIDAAGGATADADPARVNLARPLQDGEHVHLPRQGEEPPAAWDAGPPEGAAPAPEGPGVQGEGTAERIDLNRASTAELETLPGIGPAKATAIVRHREQHGPFREPGDLRAVSGIGEKTFQQLADLVTVR